MGTVARALQERREACAALGGRIAFRVGAEAFVVDLGAAAVSSGTGEADVLVELERSAFEALLAGKLDARRALLDGTARIQGEPKFLSERLSIVLRR